MYENSVLLVNKPFGWSSFQVVKTLREALGLKKAGHAGTLDPLATGLLIVCTNSKTKAIAHFQCLDKVYEGCFELGKTTPSFDAETDVDHETPYDHITPQAIHAAAKTFIGTIWQVPPAYSAIKQQGQRAYHKARNGQPVRLPPRQVTIHSFEIKRIALPHIYFRITCGKGVYIRSIARDIGQVLEVGAFLTALERVAIGPYHINTARSVRDIICSVNPNAFRIG